MSKLTMTREEIYDFLQEPRLCYVATLTKTGHPHVTPIWCYYDGRYFYMTLMDGNPKSRSLSRDPRISIAVSSDSLPYKAVVVHGTAELIRGDVRPFIRDIAKKYAGDGQADSITDMLMKNPQVVIKVTPNRIYSWDQSKGTFDEVAAAEKTGIDLRIL
ncbi:MAG TPA: PPOX class F420-dependent oxidoreductase [Thermodesulfobacteriota bacterium]|nr:PPOX class F420-dependent oxidoreductase [Thermodesulfobacteriota bacterium]